MLHHLQLPCLLGILSVIRPLFLLLSLTLAWPAASPAQAQPAECDALGKVIPLEVELQANKDAVAAGTMYVEPSTLHSLGFEWLIAGDANRNAKVSVRYRVAGSDDWRQGMDLLRMNGEVVNPDIVVRGEVKQEGLNYVCPNMFAGSVLFLEPGTRYEVELHLQDPDGGEVKRTMLVPTKAEPALPTLGKRLHVYPQQFTGDRQQPEFKTLAEAYEAAQSGDRILLHAGEYTLPPLALNKQNTREKPIAIVAAGDGAVTLKSTEGTNQKALGFDVAGGKHHGIAGLTFVGHYAGVGNSSHKQATIGLTVRHCEFVDNGWAGVFITGTNNRDLLVSDNVFRPSQFTWQVWKKGVTPQFPYKGVWIGGQGVDVCYNRVIGSKDGVSVHQPSSRPLEADFAEKMVALDFYNNDIRQLSDDNEADGGQHNIRFFRNRVVDTYVGLSTQPIFGGPCYLVRNVLHNIERNTALKFNLHPAGIVVLNNTFIGGSSTSRNWSNCHLHNNLFLAIRDKNPTFDGGPLDPGTSTISHNGFRLAGPVNWLTSNPKNPGQLRPDKKIQTLADLESLGIATHSVTVTLDDFQNVKPPGGIEHPNLDGDIGDARLKPTSAAVDAGLKISGVTDGYAGQAPDLGAYEVGAEVPHYGPRASQ